jgi:hypothetical protein
MKRKQRGHKDEDFWEFLCFQRVLLPDRLPLLSSMWASVGFKEQAALRADNRDEIFTN